MQGDQAAPWDAAKLTESKYIIQRAVVGNNKKYN